jgi:cytochrome oxidase Cu insertion factor (SCO1/SenC/PrrC family)
MRRLRPLGLAVVLVGLATLTSAAPSSLDDLMMDMRITPLDPQSPPPFVVTRLDGGPLKLGDVRGQAVLVYFWATW